MKYKPLIFLGLTFLLILNLLPVLYPTVTIAAPPILPPRPEDDLLPPRPEDDAKEDDQDQTDDSDEEAGAYLELQVQAAPPAAWSIVQWQDNTGNWHKVEGWQGTLDPQGIRRWWVAPKDFNTGPFRWLLTAGPQGEQLAASQPFTLPAFPHETRYVYLSFTP